MEKQVDDKDSDSAVVYEEYHHGHSGDHKEDKHHSKEHNDEVVDGEGKEKSTPGDTHDDGRKGAGHHQSQEIPLLHEKHASNDKDAGMTHALSDKMDTHGNEDAGMMHEPEGTSTTHEKQEHNVEHACPAHEPPENPSYGKHDSHNKDADISIEKPVMHGKVSHDHEVAAGTHEKSATHGKATHDDEHIGLAHECGERHKVHEKATHDDEHVGLAHESGERHKTHGKHIDNAQDVEGLHETAERPTTLEKLAHVHTDSDLMLQAKYMDDDEAGHASRASKKQSPVDGEHKSDVEGMSMCHTPGDKSPKQGDDAGVAHEHGHERRCDVLHAGTSQEHREKCRSVDDECESKNAFSDENSSRERVHFSRGSTPDVDTPTQSATSPFANTKPSTSKSGSKGVGNAERGPGSADGNLETPPTSWAFSARASIAPSKFDHMATLRITYAAYKESNQGKEGVPLSLLPEILESARFMVPPPRDLVPLLRRIDIEYKLGDLVRWSLLQHLALQIERKEARYPSVFIPRPSVARPNSNSPNSSWKALQRSPTRRTHPEDDCPELEPQLAWGVSCQDGLTASVSAPSSSLQCTRSL